MTKIPKEVIEKQNQDRAWLRKLPKNLIIEEYIRLKSAVIPMYEGFALPAFKHGLKMSPGPDEQRRRGRAGGNKKHETGFAKFKEFMDQNFNNLNPNDPNWNWTSLSITMGKSPYNYKIDPDTLKKYMEEYNRPK